MQPTNQPENTVDGNRLTELERAKLATITARLQTVAVTRSNMDLVEQVAVGEQQAILAGAKARIETEDAAAAATAAEEAARKAAEEAEAERKVANATSQAPAPTGDANVVELRGTGPVEAHAAA